LADGKSATSIPAYIREIFGGFPGTLPVTEAIAQRTIALPFHNNLTES
jgi:dTDP-4-amino-4,6-dideoxygalactose transaminase